LSAPPIGFWRLWAMPPVRPLYCYYHLLYCCYKLHIWLLQTP